MSSRNNKKGVKGSKGLNIENRYIKRKFDINKKQYTYGADDKLPQEIIEVLFSSKNAVKGMRKRARYMAAYGFSEPSQIIQLSCLSMKRTFTPPSSPRESGRT